MCAVPPVSRDALTHHLAIPKLYILHGGIYELPHIICSYYPELLDLIYCIPMIFHNDILPKYIHFLFALAIALLIYRYVKKRFNIFYGLLSALFFLSLPVIIKLSITIYVDLGLIFFSFAALLSLLKWRGSNYLNRWLILSGICCGLALSTKYNGLLTLFLLTALTPVIYLNKNKKIKYSQYLACKYGVIFLFIALVIFSPWMIKNYIWTKNPIFPLYKNFFHALTIKDNEPLTKSTTNNNTINNNIPLNHFQVRKYVYKETGWQTITIPLRIFFQGEDDNPKYFDGRLNPLLFFLPLIAFVNFKSKGSSDDFDKKILLLFSLLYILIVFFQIDMRIRWIGPAIPPLVILSSYGLKKLFTKLSSYKILSFMAILILISVFSLNFIYAFNLFRKTDPLPYIFNQTTRAQYIQKFRPEYATLEFANNNLGKKAKILAFFLGNRRYYSNHKIRFNYPIFLQIVNQADNEDKILDTLKHNGYTDLIINYPKFNNWIQLNFKENKRRLIVNFFQTHTKKIFTKDDHGLYHLN